jgi:hypothetical protein
MEREIARQISQLMLEYFAKLNASVKLVQDNCSSEEFQRYRRAAATVMGDMTAEIMIPIFKEHPDLEPEDFK